MPAGQERMESPCHCTTHHEQTGEVVLEELLESLVELQAHKLGPSWGGGLFGGLGWRGPCPTGLIGLVHTGTVVINVSGWWVKATT